MSGPSIRSQDVTFFHDWFSKVGQGAGDDRYNFGTGDGNLKAYSWTSTKARPRRAMPTKRSRLDDAQLRGPRQRNQLLPHNFRARGRVDYFPASRRCRRSTRTSTYDVSRNQRAVRREHRRRIWHLHAERHVRSQRVFLRHDAVERIRKLAPDRGGQERAPDAQLCPVFFISARSSRHLLRESKQTTRRESRSAPIPGVTRLDLSPQIRYPFKKWQWLTANSTVAGAKRTTHGALHRIPASDAAGSTVIDQPLNRQFFTLQTQFVGPVFNRIWDTPDNGYAEKFKHTVEPFVTVQKTTSIDNFTRIVTLDGTDSFVGGTNLNYGLNNRFFAKRKSRPARSARRASSSASSSTRPTTPISSPRSTIDSTRRARLAHRPATSRRSRSPFAPRRRTRSTPASVPNSTPISPAADDFRPGHLWVAEPGPGDRRLEQEVVHRGAFGFQRSGDTRSLHQRVDEPAHDGQPLRRALRVQLRCAAIVAAHTSESPASTTPSAAVSRSNTRPTTSRRAARSSACPRTTGSSCRSRSPASATSHPSTAR